VAGRHLLAVCLSNVGALTSHNPMGLHGLEQGYFYLLLLTLNFFICEYIHTTLF
jgi:hypothetical protein